MTDSHPLLLLYYLLSYLAAALCMGVGAVMLEARKARRPLLAAWAVSILFGTIVLIATVVKPHANASFVSVVLIALVWSMIALLVPVVVLWIAKRLGWGPAQRIAASVILGAATLLLFTPFWVLSVGCLLTDNCI